MNRAQLEADLTAYVDGELDPARAAAVAEALAGDPDLRALEARLRASATLLQGLATPEASPALRRAVLAAVEAPTWRERLAAWLSPPRVGLALAGAAAAAAVWVGARPAGFGGDEEKLLVAQHLELLEDYEVLGLDDAGDLEVVAALHELEVRP